MVLKNLCLSLTLGKLILEHILFNWYDHDNFW